MKFSSKIEKCGLSPMRKFAPYANEAAKKGKKLYHLNIGQPDIATPAAYFDAVKSFSQPVLAYAPSDGVPEMIDAVVNYYGKIDAPITNKQVLITTQQIFFIYFNKFPTTVQVFPEKSGCVFQIFLTHMLQMQDFF